MELSTQNLRCHERCCRFLAAAGSLLNDSYRITAEYVDAGKIARYATRLAGKEFRKRKEGRGNEAIRFLSAVTAQGITSYTNTPKVLCERIYLVEDDYGAVSRLLMNAIRSHALAAGLNIISCYCISSPFEKLEHILIPEIGVGFLTANRYHPFDIDCFRRIHAKRFMNAEGLRSKKQRLSFNRKAIGELLGEASRLLAEAKDIHDELETCYTVHMDFDKVNEKSARIIETFVSMCKPKK
ncbi:hypothetical protein [Hydrogenoanaerobacterium sp.]|uniref:hypothetical protein n=1 Tax=Hydrogenoanaerobacterium sp. TaxID=2953763 RepID=UPI00289AA1AB|nr:hypothetical protein [Hydrogenoanaerobacterium sp.]